MINAVAQSWNLAGHKGNLDSFESTVAVALRFEELRRKDPSFGVRKAEPCDAAGGETNVRLREVGAGPAERVEHDHGHALAACVDTREQAAEPGIDHFPGESFGKLVAADGVLIDGISHHAGGQVVRHIEQ